MLPHAEVPDHLPFVLELTALVDSDVGCRLFTEHRVPIDVLRDGLVDVSSLYEHPITEFCETLTGRNRSGGVQGVALGGSRKPLGCNH